MEHSPVAQPEEAAPDNRRGLLAVESLARAARQVSLYGPEHPVAVVALRDACQKWAGETEGLVTEVRAEEGKLLWNRQALPQDRSAVSRLLEAMQTRLIASITVEAQVQDEELRKLISLLAEDPHRIIAAGGAMRVFGRGAPSIHIEDVDFARQLRESEAIWLEACSRLDTPLIERLRETFENCVRTLKFLGDHTTMSRILVSAGSEGSEEGEVIIAEEARLSPEDTVAMKLACLIQSAGELAYFADESYWQGWRDGIRVQLIALGSEWVARVLRAPAGVAVGHPDMLTLVAREMEPMQCVAAVLDYPGAIQSERSRGLALVLSRVMPDDERREVIEPLLHQEARARGISDEVYQNVVGLLIAEAAKHGRASRSGPAKRDGRDGRGPGAGESLEDLLQTAGPEGARRSHVTVLAELLDADLDLDHYGRVLAVLSEKVQQWAEQGDHESSQRAMQELRRAAHRETQGDPGRRAMAAGALARCGTAGVVAGVLSAVGEAASQTQAELMILLGGLGDEGMAALVELALQPGSHRASDAVRMILRRGSAGFFWLRRLLSEAPLESLRMVIPAVLGTGDPRVIGQLAVLGERPDIAARLALIRAITAGKCEQAVGVLTGLLDDPAGEVKLAAVKALADLRAAEAVPALCGIVSQRPSRSRGAHIREAAMAALGAIGSEASVPTLAKVLAGREFLSFIRGVRPQLSAAAALAKIGGYQAFKALEQGGRLHSGAVRDACRIALSRLSQATAGSHQPSPQRPAEDGSR